MDPCSEKAGKCWRFLTKDKIGQDRKGRRIKNRVRHGHHAVRLYAGGDQRLEHRQNRPATTLSPSKFWILSVDFNLSRDFSMKMPVG